MKTTSSSVHHIRTNGSATVHLGVRAHEVSRWIPLCGSGETTTYRRKPSSYKATSDHVTCKKCLKRLADNAKIEAFLEMVDADQAATVSWWAA